MKDVISTLNQLPMIIEYFVPGFIFIYFFRYFTSKKSTSYTILWSVAISYSLKAIYSSLHSKIFVNKSFTWSIRAIILCVSAFILSIIFVYVYEKLLIKLSFKINHKSFNDDIWQDVIDDKNGNVLRFVCDDGKVYTGQLDMYEEKGNDSWFVLKDYRVEEDDTFYESESINCKSRLMINLKDVKRVELFYG